MLIQDPYCAVEQKRYSSHPLEAALVAFKELSQVEDVDTVAWGVSERIDLVNVVLLIAAWHSSLLVHSR